MAQFNKSYGGVAKSSRGGRGGRGARVVSWFEWKISNVEAEAGRAKEQLDKFKAIYKGHVERLAELEDKKEESKKDEKEE
ncbi:hypothetical protein PG988_001389 [Apiospora saccharicola]